MQHTDTAAADLHVELTKRSSPKCQALHKAIRAAPHDSDLRDQFEQAMAENADLVRSYEARYVHEAKAERAARERELREHQPAWAAAVALLHGDQMDVTARQRGEAERVVQSHENIVERLAGARARLVDAHDRAVSLGVAFLRNVP